MSATAESRPLRLVAGTVQRRWRLGALLGLLIGLALAAYSLVVLGPGAELSQMVPVLRAARAIQAGNTITADELGTSLIRTQDPNRPGDSAARHGPLADHRPGRRDGRASW